MIYLYGYLGIGVTVLTLVFGADWLTRKGEPDPLRAILDAVNKGRNHLAYRIVNTFMDTVVAAVAVVFWPAALYRKVRQIFGRKRERVRAEARERREFAVARDHLQERRTVPQIEAREGVTDALGAVPDLPFGHLNAVWRAFINTADPGDEIWSFTAPWQTAWGCKELRAGYVIVRDGVPGAHMLTVLKRIEYEPEASSDRGMPGPPEGKTSHPRMPSQTSHLS